MYPDGRDIANLNNHQLRAVMNALLTVEANSSRVPLADLELNTRDTDPDAGIDARIKWPARAPHDALPTGRVVLQFKSGKLTLPNLEKEFAKHGVQGIRDSFRRNYGSSSLDRQRLFFQPRPEPVQAYQVRPLLAPDMRTILQASGDQFPEEVIGTTVRVSGRLR